MLQFISDMKKTIAQIFMGFPNDLVKDVAHCDPILAAKAVGFIREA